MLFAYCMLGGLIFLFTPAHVTSRLQLAYANLFRVPLSTGRTLTLASRTPPAAESATAKDYARLLADHQRLRNDVANLQAQLKEASTTINQLAKVRTTREWDRMGFLLAGVITVVNPAQTELIINAGREEGVAPEQFVMAMSDHSLIGRVCDVSPHTAKVRLIGNPASHIPVQIGSSGVHGVMEGRGDGIAKIRLVSAKHAVALEDPVYVRQETGVLDVPMVAGRIAECRNDPDKPLLWDITVRATCDIATLERVAVIVLGQ
jgi:hypothetical protein